MTEKSIVLASHNAAHREQYVQAFAAVNPAFTLVCVQDVDALLDLLERETVHDVAFVLLDLDLPGLTANELLTKLSQDLRFRSLPVIVMASQDQPEAVLSAYQCGASAYIRQTTDEQERRRMAQAMVDFWCDINVTPKPGVVFA